MTQTFEDFAGSWGIDVDQFITSLNIIQLMSTDREKAYKLGDLLAEMRLAEIDLDDLPPGSDQEEELLETISVCKKKIIDLGWTFDD